MLRTLFPVTFPDFRKYMSRWELEVIRVSCVVVSDGCGRDAAATKC
jgi:hypothetical protein